MEDEELFKNMVANLSIANSFAEELKNRGWSVTYKAGQGIVCYMPIETSKCKATRSQEIVVK